MGKVLPNKVTHPQAAPKSNREPSEPDTPGLMTLNIRETLNSVSCLFANTVGMCENIAGKIASGELTGDDAHRYRRMLNRIVSDADAICNGDVAKLRLLAQPEAWKVEHPHEHTRPA